MPPHAWLIRNLRPLLLSTPTHRRSLSEPYSSLWLAQQRADPTISRVIQLLNQNARPDSDELDGYPTIKLYFDIWAQLFVEENLLKHVNERAISTRIVVPAVLREEVFRAIHEPAHHGYEATLRRISQRLWWPRVRSEVSALLKACETCDRDRNSNLSPRVPLGHRPADQPFGTLYIDIVGGQGSFCLGVSP